MWNMATQANRELPSPRFLLRVQRGYAYWRAIGEVNYADKLSGSTPAHDVQEPEHFVSTNSVKYWPCFGAIILLSVLMRLACFTGLIGSDDLSYSYYAQQISTGHYVQETNIAGTLDRPITGLQVPGGIQLELRYAVIVPVGVVYRLLGVIEW